MKLKDIAALALLALVLLVIGILLINHFGKGTKSRSAEIEVVTPIDPSFNQEAKEILLGSRPDQPAENFSVPVNLQGLGNTSPFRPGQ